MLPLDGVGVIVTRPEQQATHLCRLLEAQGATTLRLPAIEIRPRAEELTLQQLAGPLDAFDLVVFTSANAVRFGSKLLGQRHDLTVAAIGPATVSALTRSGYSVAIQPDGRFDSEALLAHPSLENLTGRRILLIKGSGGRQLLEQELARRGASVVCAEVYERIPARPDGADLGPILEHIEAGRMQVITATSLDIGEHLLRMVPKDEQHKLHWLVPGERVAAGLRERGLHAPVLTAASAEDRDLVAALERWRVG